MPSLIYSTATSGAAGTLTDTGQNMIVNQFSGYMMILISGTGAGQTGQIVSNTSTVFTMVANWQTAPDSTTVYAVLPIELWKPVGAYGDAVGTGAIIIAEAPYLFNGTTYDRQRNSINTRQVGVANTQLQFVITMYNCSQLALYFAASGGVAVFASQSITVEVSTDNVNFVQVEGTGLNAGTAATFAKQYDMTHLSAGAGQVVNPAAYQYVRITVPALGSSVVCTATVSGK